MENNNIQVNNYAAAFIDLLGQRDALKGCGLLPSDRDELIIIAKKSIGAINRLHSQFDTFYNAFSSTDAQSTVPQEIRRNNNNFQAPQIKFQRFSDGLVIFISLASNQDHSPISGVFGLLAASGSLCLNFLAEQMPLRAGIDIAWGTEKNENELYGCVVAKSYELESTVAQYPRVVVGEEVVNYLQANQLNDESNLNTALAKAMATVCLELLDHDNDGHIIVDYLGPGFKKYIANNIGNSIFKDAYNFIEQQIEHWRAQENKKLISRYETLRSYFDKKQEFWGP